MPEMALHAPKRVRLAAPRGYCAGVDRAVETVERALDMHGPPVYVRKEIVHNKHVVEQLSERGAIFVEEETEVPRASSSYSRPTASRPPCTRTRRRASSARSTRPARSSPRSTTRLASSPHQGYTIIMIGHAGHEEVEGTMGEAPEAITLVETVDDGGLRRGSRSRACRLHHADHPFRRRDGRDH